MTKTTLEIVDLCKSYESGGETTKVLTDLDLVAATSEMIMIMGPSGSGKTTLLNLIGGIDQPDRGRVSVSGQTITGLSSKKLNAYRQKTVGFIFQFYNLIPTLTALENVELGLETVMKRGPELTERAMRYLRLVGLDDKVSSFPQELSAGQQQRVAIARALAKEPALILADEPTGNLDEDREQQIMALMQQLQHEIGITFIIVSHNSRLLSFVDRALDLRHGRLEPIAS